MPTNGLPDGRELVVLSAHAEELLTTDADAILRYLRPGTDVSAVAATLLRTRRLRRHRAVVRAASIAELVEGLQALSAGNEHPMVATSSETSTGKTVFVFPGQGNQWPSMGADAYDRSPVYRAQVDECVAAFAAAGHVSPLPYLTAHTGGGDWSQVEIQGAQFVHAVCVAHIWQSCGVTPDITVGHSLGEVAAAYVAGRITLTDAVAVVIARAKAVDRLQGDYRMAALGISVGEAEHLIATVEGWLEVSAVNSKSSVVVSGQRDAVTALVATASDRGLFARELGVNYPGHTTALEALHDDLSALLPKGQFGPAPVQFIGSVTGQAVPAGTGFAHYWYRNLRDTVRFDRAVDAARRQGGARFIEMSAHASLLFALEDLTGDGPEPPLIVGSGRRDEPLIDTLSAGIAAVAVADPGFGWSVLADTGMPVLQGFPNAPMSEVHVWAEPEPLAPVFGLTVSSEKWKQSAVFATTGAHRRIAVVDLVGPGSSLSAQLRTAIARHGDAEPAQPGEADLVLAIAPLLDHPDAEVAAAQIARIVGEGLFDYADAGGSACRDLCLVTVGGEHVLLDEPVALPAQAALAAMHRSIGYERPDQAFRHLDLPSWEIDDATATVVIDAARGRVHEGAVRDSASGPALFVRTLSESDAPALDWKLDDGLLDNVVITGGTGAVGLHFARYLAEQGARRIVLLSRTGVDAAIVAELTGVAGFAGVEIVAPPCDLRSAEQVSAVARDHGATGASLLIHAAGAASFDDFADISSESFSDTAAAKIGGFARMTDLWPLRSDTRILVCSSVSGVWGGRGHAAYSAANRMLDVMAGQLRAKGQHCVALRYGLWRTDPGRDSGITARAGVSAIERSGLLPMAPGSAVAASLREHESDPMIMAADPDRLRKFLDSQTVEQSGAAAPSASTRSGEGPTRVIAEVASVLGIDAATIDRQTSLLDLGLDSLLALDLRKRLRRVTGASVPLGALLGGITSAELIADLDTRLQKVETTRD
ncbi:mycobactin polyketide synthase MbtD [Mycobacterium sp. 29Ha]|uniref:mycobactin polyketide synthase MbtD n=1 Tax=Mycobacterium sp. 29Ha TaxID=2939268 RepID=UPI002938EC78|nr:mycobactin polyketide synthase MbtD [Mycobacterium sp. 29Ha]MDV3130874.1 mycobactin polyketide synthase MbtD [Mycobacterium sp. 29Ha]